MVQTDSNERSFKQQQHQTNGWAWCGFEDEGNIRGQRTEPIWTDDKIQRYGATSSQSHWTRGEVRPHPEEVKERAEEEAVQEMFKSLKMQSMSWKNDQGQRRWTQRGDIIYRGKRVRGSHMTTSYKKSYNTPSLSLLSLSWIFLGPLYLTYKLRKTKIRCSWLMEELSSLPVYVAKRRK